MTAGERGAHPDPASEADIRSWTSPGTAPLVPEIELLLAEDIHRTWSATDEAAPPFWAFAWAGGQALARHVLDHPEVVAGRRVLDLASGSGIVALAALRAGAAAVVASESDARARAALALNAAVAGVEVTVVGDVVGAGEVDDPDDPDDPDDRPDPEPADEVALDVDVVLAGDVFYEQPMARHMERFLDEAAAAGVEVLVGDPGREYLPRRRCTALTVHEVPGTADLEGRAVTTTTVWRFS